MRGRVRAPAQGRSDRAHVLILGETGRARSSSRRRIHQASKPARTSPSSSFDCGAIPPTLAEAALFGHERGAFTGAVDKRISPFVEADGGTIFLDELGELPVDVQPKLLRALAEQRVKSVGSNNYRPFNARIIAATRRDLVREVNAGTFRSDLYFRVAQLRVELPALRERLEDIPSLVRKMVLEIGDKNAYARITNDSLERLMRHDWPGNVRELRNVVSWRSRSARRGRSIWPRTWRPSPRRRRPSRPPRVAAPSRTRSATCSRVSSASTSPPSTRSAAAT